MEVVLRVGPVIAAVLAGAATWLSSGRSGYFARYSPTDGEEYGRSRLRRTFAVMIAVSICGTALAVAWDSGCFPSVLSALVSVGALVTLWRRHAIRRHLANTVAAALARNVRETERLLVDGRLRFGFVRYESCYRTVLRSFLDAGPLSRKETAILDMMALMDRTSARSAADEAALERLSAGMPYAEEHDTVDSLLRVTGAYLSPGICSELAALKASYFETDELWPIALSDAVTEGRPCYYRHRVAVVPVALCDGRRTADADSAEVADLYIFNDAMETVAKSRRRFILSEMIAVKQTGASCLSIIFRKSNEPLVIVSEEAAVIRVVVERLRHRK
ncbi:MAG: hypothetical protein K2L01_06595 [Rikenellaceae bacterium]|nr:hypothetical protein [Rikenellaceae bacterium]